MQNPADEAKTHPFNGISSRKIVTACANCSTILAARFAQRYLQH
jgi:hypothetical protein